MSYRGMRGYIGGAGFPIGLRGMGRGLGQDYSESSNPAASPASSGYVDPGIITSPSAPNPFTQSLANALPGLLQSWTTIGGRVLAPSVQYTGPGGVTYSAPAGSSAGSSFPLSLGTPGGLGSMLPLLVIGGLVLFLAVKK